MDVRRTLGMIVNKLEQVLRVRRNISWSPKVRVFMPVTKQRTQNNNLDSAFFPFSLTRRLLRTVNMLWVTQVTKLVLAGRCERRCLRLVKKNLK